MMVQPPQAHNPENVTTMGKVYTSDLMMIIRWIINVSSRSPKLEWASLTYTTLHVMYEEKKDGDQEN